MSIKRASRATKTQPHWLNEREHSAWRALLTMHAQLEARLASEMKRDANLSGADYAVLVGLSEAEGQRIRPSELGLELGWEKSRLSKQISRMEDRGLVDREICPTDARGSFVVLTDLGRDTIEAAAPEHAEQVRTWFVTPLTDEQLDQLTSISRAIIDHLDAGS
ncbi:MAG: transcriptional regulator, MarR family [Actinomycetia bacterium]|nr:transcriptional regulator, MarR family [Actinomycetes bacterium]